MDGDRHPHGQRPLLVRLWRNKKDHRWHANIYEPDDDRQVAVILPCPRREEAIARIEAAIAFHRPWAMYTLVRETRGPDEPPTQEAAL